MTAGRSDALMHLEAWRWWAWNDWSFDLTILPMHGPQCLESGRELRRSSLGSSPVGGLIEVNVGACKRCPNGTVTNPGVPNSA
jgi:hypothetical protein